MSAINFHTKEISVKIVYYGPGLCGKTSSLHAIYNSLPKNKRPQLVSLATEVDRTIFFDFLPVTAYRIRDFKVRLQLYTVPGQVFYNATRKLVLNGVDGLVFVADSQRAMRDSNLESLQNLEENLAELGMEIDHVPMVIDCNKRDLSDIDSVEEMDRLYNAHKVPLFATVATTGAGVLDALRAVSQMVVNNLVRKGLGTTLSDTAPSGDSVPAIEGPAQPGVVNTPPPAVESPSTADSLAAAAARMTGDQQPPATAPHRDGLWPVSSSVLGPQIEQALAMQRWSEAVRAGDALLHDAAARWAAAAGDGDSDPVARFLLLRGISGHRFRSFTQAVEAARNGHTVTRTEAMNALIIALEAVW